MTDALISLGANLGNVRLSINTAAAMLCDRFGHDNVRLSSLLESPAIGGPKDQQEFLNAAAHIRTPLDVFQIWHILRDIESSLGRSRRQRWESRRIDLDILTCSSPCVPGGSGLCIWTPHLKIPHPRMVTRSFALLPAAELCPHFVEPVSQQQLDQLATRFPYDFDPSEGTLIRKLQSFSSRKPIVLVVSVDQKTSRSLELTWQTNRIPNASTGVDVTVVDNYAEVAFECVNSGRTPDPQSIRQISNLIEQHSPNLMVLGIRCQDSSNVAWEDYAQSWAICLGMQPVDRTDCVPAWHLPKYLLNCDDVEWAAHELSAAIAAMSCELKIAEQGFDI